MMMIDAWMIYSLFIPFLEVIIHTKLVLMKEELQKPMNAIYPSDGRFLEKTELAEKAVKQRKKNFRKIR